MQCGYFNIMKKQAWDSQLTETNAAEPVSPKEGAQQCFTTWWGGSFLSGFTPVEGTGVQQSQHLPELKLPLTVFLWKKGLMEPVPTFTVH